MSLTQHRQNGLDFTEFSDYKRDVDYPSALYFAITKHDSTNISYNSKAVVTRAILCDTAGTYSVVRPDGTAVSMYLIAGYNPIACIRVNSTGSAGGNLWALC